MDGSIPTAVHDRLEREGYETTVDERGRPVATAPDGGGSLLPGDGSLPLELRPVGGPPDPWRPLVALADALERDHGVAFCPVGPDPAGARDRLRSVLSAPTGVADEDDRGNRTFYPSPDRVHLAEGGLALVESRRPSFTWREEPADAGAGGRTGTDDPSLVLYDGDDPVLALNGVEGLSCPGPDREAVPFGYRREDGVFAVRDRTGRLVGTFASVRAMRDHGFAPVPAPVVPERLFPTTPTAAWAVLDPEAGTVRTADGRRSLPDAGR